VNKGGELWRVIAKSHHQRRQRRDISRSYAMNNARGLVRFGMLALILLSPISALWAVEVVYTEEFSSQPFFEVCGGHVPEPGEFFLWDSVAETYKVRINETSPTVAKFACSPAFDLVEPADAPWCVGADMNIVQGSFGLPLSVRFVPHGDPGGNHGVLISFKGAHDRRIAVQDYSVGSYFTPVVSYGSWYRFSVCSNTPGLADISAIEVESGDILMDFLDVPFNPTAFDTFVVGNNTGWGDGSVGEVHADNVFVTTDPPVQDADGDGLADDEDSCPNSVLGETIVFGSCDSGVENQGFDDGCTMQDMLAECAANAGHHGQFVRCVAQLTNDWKRSWIISGSEKGKIQRCAAQAGTP